MLAVYRLFVALFVRVGNLADVVNVGQDAAYRNAMKGLAALRPVAVPVQPVDDGLQAEAAGVHLENGDDPLGLLGHDLHVGKARVVGMGDPSVSENLIAAVPSAELAALLHAVAHVLRNLPPFVLGHGPGHLKGELAHRRVCLELLRQAAQGDAVLVQQLDDVQEIRQIAGETIQPQTHDLLEATAAGIIQKFAEFRSAINRLARATRVDINLVNIDVRLAAVVLQGVPLGIQAEALDLLLG